jgi:capsid assembly protease
MQGYDAIREAFIAALADDKAKAIVLSVDSPGGEVSGAFDLTDEIFAARGTKPIVAIADEVGYSAAYALASAADLIIVPRTGGVGSIGIVCCHMDFSKALSGAGVGVTFIQYGAQKTESAPEKPLSDDAKGRLQADVDQMGEIFVETVARNRGMTAASVRETEAGTFLGAKAVDVGLADAVMPPAAAFQDLLSRLN